MSTGADMFAELRRTMTAATGRMPSHIAIGLFGGLLLSWCMCLSGAPELFGSTGGQSESFLVVTALCTVSLATTQCVCAALHKRVDPLLSRRSARYGASLCLFLGLGSLLLGSHDHTSLSPALLGGGACLCSLGITYLQAFYCSALGHEGASLLLPTVASSFLVAGILGFLLNILPYQWQIVVYLSLPFLLALMSALVSSRQLSDDTSGAAVRAPRTRPLAAASLLFGIFCLGLSSQFVRASQWATEDISSLSGNLSMHETGIGIAALVVLVFSWVTSKHKDPASVSALGSAAPITIAAGVMLTNLLGSPYAEVAQVVVGIGIGLFEILIFYWASILCKRMRMSAFLSIGLPWSAMGVAALVGQFARQWLDSSAALTPIEWQITSTIVVFVLFSVSLLCLVPNERRVAALFGTDALPSVLSSALVQVAASSSPTDPQSSFASDNPTQSDFSEPSYPGIERVALNRADTGRSTDEHLDMVFQTHGLTPRETEVARLLAKGRSMPFIQDALGISRGTVNTHVVHIYEKLGVHSRQEFIDVLDNQA